MIDAKVLKQQCSGRWIGIFRTFGMDVRDDGRHQGCPVCGNGRNSHRFRIDKDGSGRWICTQCGSGSGFMLVQRYLGCSFPEALQKIQSIIGGCEVQKTQTNNDMSESDIKKMLNRIWSGSSVLTGGDPVSKYLHTRKLVLQPDNVRYCPVCYESDTKTERPAMVARIVDCNNTPVALHRTYLNSEQSKKADIKSPKKITPGLGPLAGCAIRLFQPTGSELGICEGIETGIACKQLFNIPVWACISTAIMEGFVPPEGIRKITIFADNDANYSGAKSAYNLANKLYLKDLIVDVEMPEKQNTDFNDILI